MSPEEKIQILDQAIKTVEERTKIDFGEKIKIAIEQNDKDEIEKIIKGIEEDLNKIQPDPFSDKAFKILKGKISTYIKELIKESIKNSKRENLDSVSATHVEKASDYLVSPTKNKWNHLITTIGGVILGAAITQAIGAVSSGEAITALEMSLTVGSTFLGGIMLAYSTLNR